MPDATLRSYLEAIRDLNHPMEFGGITRATTYENAVAALAILDNTEETHVRPGQAMRLVPDPERAKDTPNA